MSDHTRLSLLKERHINERAVLVANGPSLNRMKLDFLRSECVIGMNKIFLGFKEIIIIGMDHRYDYSGPPNQECRLDGPDPNHFIPDYFGNGQTWDNPALAHSEESYSIARVQFEKDGRRIIDATLDGACTIFEKADYQKVFGVPQ